MTTTTDPKSRFGTQAGKGPGGAAGPGTARGKADAADEPAPKAKRRLLPILLVLVVLLGAVGGAGYFFFLRKPSVPPPPKGGAVVVMDSMTLSLADGHYLKIQVALQLVSGAAAANTFETSHAAELVIDTFSNRDVTSLGNNATRKKLAAQLLSDIQHAYPDEVFDLYLTQFVLQ